MPDGSSRASKNLIYKKRGIHSAMYSKKSKHKTSNMMMTEKEVKSKMK